MTDRELMQQALEALDSDNPDIQLRAAIVLRERLAQPDVDYERGFIDGMNKQAQSSVDKAVNSMSRTPLTDDEIAAISVECAAAHKGDDISFARAIERAHGIGEKK